MKKSRLAFVLGIALAAVGCGSRADLDDDEFNFDLDATVYEGGPDDGDGATPGDADAASDVPVDGQGDAPHDVVADVRRDAPHDADADVAHDVVHDVPGDTAHDVVADVVHDVPADIARDVTTDPTQDVTPDAQPDVSRDAVADVTPDAPRDVAADIPRDRDFFDTFPLPDSGPVATCAACAQKACDAPINACYNDPQCAAGVGCAFTTCAGGAGFACLFGCFNGNFGALIEAIGAFRCVRTNCGPDCAGVVGGPGADAAPPPPGPTPAPAQGGAAPAAASYGGVIVAPADFPWSTDLPAEPIVLPPPEAFGQYPGMTPICGLPERAACSPP